MATPALSHFHFRVPGADDEPVRATLHVAADGPPRPTILVAHGFKGFKDWGGWGWLCDRLAEGSLAAIRFDFSHNGIGDDPETFERLDLFQKNTISKEIEDFRSLLAAVADGAFEGADRCDADRIGLIGHSLGGGVALVVARDEPRVKGVATLASVADFDRFSAEARAQAMRDGFVGMMNARTGQIMPVGRAFFEDLDAHEADYSIETAAARLGRPLLILHGTADEGVPPAEAERIAAAADPDRTHLEWIDGAAHTFGMTHPFTGPTSAIKRVAESLRAFFGKALQSTR